MVAIVLVVVASALVGCGGSHTSQVQILVVPTSGLFDQTMHIVVTGVRSGRTVTVAMRSRDGAGVAFMAQATFRSSAAGEVDLATARSSGGAYQGIDSMGLIDGMRAASGSSVPYDWRRGPHRFQLTVSEGATRIGSGAFVRRWLAPGVAMHEESIAATGFYGQYWTPPAGGPRRPAVLEFGGSEGGLHGQLIAAALASAGYPTLDIAYFAEPGLPATLTDIPLEYFARALRWLAGQPQVRRGATYVLGGSRGSEAALLLAADYPSLAHGVIASSPSDLSFAAYPSGRSAAWTWRGRPVPYSTAPVDLGPVSDAAAEIPVQHIRGPIFLDCGTSDQIWSSCAYALNIEQHLDSSHFPYPHVVYRYLGAGHHVNTLVPYEPGAAFADLSDPLGQGDTLAANAAAHARLWPRLLSFLAHPTAQTGVFTVSATARQ